MLQPILTPAIVPTLLRCAGERLAPPCACARTTENASPPNVTAAIPRLVNIAHPLRMNIACFRRRAEFVPNRVVVFDAAAASPPGRGNRKTPAVHAAVERHPVLPIFCLSLFPPRFMARPSDGGNRWCGSYRGRQLVESSGNRISVLRFSSACGMEQRLKKTLAVRLSGTAVLSATAISRYRGQS